MKIITQKQIAQRAKDLVTENAALDNKVRESEIKQMLLEMQIMVLTSNGGCTSELMKIYKQYHS